MLKFELVLPCYNESKSLEFLVTRAKNAAEAAGFKAGEFRLLMVENGSKDDSRLAFARLAKKQDLAPWFTMVPIDLNQGYGFGVLMGLKRTSAPVIGWSHADQQCDPADAINAFFEHQKEKSQGKLVLVKGVRSGRNWKDILVSRVFETLAFLLLGLRVHEMNAQPKIFERSLLESLKSPPTTFAFDLYVLYHAQKLNWGLKTIPVVFPPRVHGLSNWSSHFLSRYKTIWGMICYMWKLSRTEGRV